MRAIILVCAAAITLAGCASPQPLPAPTITLANVQRVATSVLTVVKNDVAVYEAANPNDPNTAKINSGVASLVAAVAVLNNVQAGASYQTEASSLLTVAQAVVNDLPPGTLNANDTLIANTLIANLQLIITLIPPPAAP